MNPTPATTTTETDEKLREKEAVADTTTIMHDVVPIGDSSSTVPVVSEEMLGSSYCTSDKKKDEAAANSNNLTPTKPLPVTPSKPSAPTEPMTPSEALELSISLENMIAQACREITAGEERRRIAMDSASKRPLPSKKKQANKQTPVAKGESKGQGHVHSLATSTVPRRRLNMEGKDVIQNKPPKSLNKPPKSLRVDRLSPTPERSPQNFASKPLVPKSTPAASPSSLFVQQRRYENDKQAESWKITKKRNYAATKLSQPSQQDHIKRPKHIPSTKEFTQSNKMIIPRKNKKDGRSFQSEKWADERKPAATNDIQLKQTARDFSQGYDGDDGDDDKATKKKKPLKEESLKDISPASVSIAEAAKLRAASRKSLSAEVSVWKPDIQNSQRDETKTKKIKTKKMRSSKRKLPPSPSSVSSTSTKQKTRGDGLIFEGEPDEPFPGGGDKWPTGWLKRVYQRKNGATARQTDKYWYTPGIQHKLRSLKEIKRWIHAMEIVDGDESKAKGLYKNAHV